MKSITERIAARDRKKAAQKLYDALGDFFDAYPDAFTSCPPVKGGKPTAKQDRCGTYVPYWPQCEDVMVGWLRKKLRDREGAK